MFFSKHLLERTVTLKKKKRNVWRKFLLGNAPYSIKVFTNKVFTTLAVSFLLINVTAFTYWHITEA